MRQWRVGTLSMGLLLIVLGAGLIFAQVNKVAVIDVLLNWWPLLFILLGAEVLVQIGLNKDEVIKVKYDIFSIIIVFIIVMTGLAVQGLTEVGFINQAKIALVSQDYLLKTEPAEVTVGPGIKKLVIQAPPGTLQIHTTSSSNITASASVNVSADSPEKARQILEKSASCQSYISGDTCYVSFAAILNGSDLGYRCRITEYTLVLPERLDVVIKGQNNPLKIDAGQVASNWQINGAGDIELNYNTGSDLLVNTEVH
ncbi:MAG: hypothetical protein PHO25_08765, partial [Syntrophomonadaceae bacterium]|nr:hypothetical protein [Syntrophomonadaceae bacterium]